MFTLKLKPYTLDEEPESNNKIISGLAILAKYDATIDPKAGGPEFFVSTNNPVSNDDQQILIDLGWGGDDTLWCHD